MSKIQDVPFITKVIATLSDELKTDLYDLIDGKEKTPVLRSLTNNAYAITEASDKNKVQFVTLETTRGNYTGYLAYNSAYCVLIAFKGNTQALDLLNINVAKHTFAFVNESLSILELRVELEDGKEGVTPTDLGVTNNNVHLAKGTTAIGDGVNVKTINGETLLGSGNIVVGDTGTVDGALNDDSVNPVQNKVVTTALNTKLALPATAPATRKVVTIDTNGAQDNVDGTELTTLMSNIVDSHGNARFVEGNITMNEIEGVTQAYGKWSLSGTHLMIVIAGNVTNGTIISGNTILAPVSLPSYISSKIKSIVPSAQAVINKTLDFYNISNNAQTTTMRLRKVSTGIDIQVTNALTLNSDRSFRAQFDLLIDTD